MESYQEDLGDYHSRHLRAAREAHESHQVLQQVTGDHVDLDVGIVDDRSMPNQIQIGQMMNKDRFKFV